MKEFIFQWEKHFPITTLLQDSVKKSEALVLVFSAFLSAANGIGLPLLPVLFARNIANFSALYNPNISVQLPSNVLHDEVVNNTNRGIQKTSLVILGFSIAALISTFLVSYIQFQVARKISNRLRMKYFLKVVRQDAYWYATNRVAEISTKLTRIDLIETMLGHTSMEVIRDLFAFLGGFTFSFASSWRMTLVVLSFMPIIAVIGTVSAIIVRKESSKCQNSLENLGAVIHDALTNIRTVWSYNGQETEKKHLEKALSGLSKAKVRRAIYSAMATGLLMLTIITCFSVGFFFGSRFVRSGILSISDAIAASSIVPAVFAAFRLADGQKNVAYASEAARSILGVLQNTVKIDPMEEGGIIPKDFKGGITFENVDFSYDFQNKNPLKDTDKSISEQESQNLGDEMVLSNINLRISPGESQGLCGPSGGGKSTIFGLISRCFDVSSGRILLDGKYDIRDVNVPWLRSQIGHVGQKSVLFRGTVRENIALGALRCIQDVSQVSFERVRSAACMANAHEFIEKMSLGYDTLIEEGGGNLSGGQKQRICIARAIIGNPKILLLDECTSSLDSENETKVQNALDRVSKSCTTIFIAHKLRTIRKCDRISVLSRGKIIEEGAHFDLIRKDSGLYKEMSENQLPEQEKVQSADDDSFSRNEEEITSDESSMYEKIQKFSGNVLEEKGETVNADRNFPSSPIGNSETTHCTKFIRRILSMQKDYRMSIVFGSFGSILAGASWPLAAASISELLHLGPADGKETEVRKWILLLFSCGVAAFVGISAQNIFFEYCGEELTRRIRKSYFSELLFRDLHFFGKHGNSTGSLTLWLINRAILLREISSDLFGLAGVLLASILTAVTVALYYCWRISLIGFLFMPGILLSGFTMFTGRLDYGNEHIVESVRLSSEVLSMNRAVSELGLQKHFIEKYENLIRSRSNFSTKDFLFAALRAYISASPYGLFGSTFYAGSIILKKGTCDLLGFNKSILAIFLGSVLVGEMSNVVPDVRKSLTAAAEYFRFIDESCTFDFIESNSIHHENAPVSRIEFCNVSFSYDNQEQFCTLKSFSSSVGRGETLALVGPSGSGKSTVLRLLNRFYSNFQGTISVDGEEIREVQVSRLRQRMALVLQDAEMFNRSILENITYGICGMGRSGEIHESLLTASKTAQAHDFISELPNGYETIIGPGGIDLSGGQRQRIALARALIRNPSVLLLDEISSALDSKTEHALYRDLKNSFGNITKIVIAHRLGNVREADCIAVLHGGMLVEKGTHEELLPLNGLYSKLYKAELG